MRDVLSVTIGLALTACAAFADFGDVVYSWVAPGVTSDFDMCRGLAYDGKYIWCSCDLRYSPDTLFRCVPSNGSVVASFTNPIPAGSRGITYRKFGGQDILDIAVYYNNKIYFSRVNFKGEVLASVNVNLPNNQTFTSICFDGTNEWVLDPETEYNILYKLNAAGTPISSIRVNDIGSGYGIDKQAEFFWLSIGYNAKPPGLFGGAKLRPNGSLVASFGDSYQYVYDCCCEDNHFWFVGRTRTVYCIDVSNAPAVLPASVGRIKALYR